MLVKWHLVFSENLMEKFFNMISWSCPLSSSSSKTWSLLLFNAETWSQSLSWFSSAKTNIQAELATLGTWQYAIFSSGSVTKIISGKYLLWLFLKFLQNSLAFLFLETCVASSSKVDNSISRLLILEWFQLSSILNKTLDPVKGKKQKIIEKCTLPWHNISNFFLYPLIFT